MEGYNEQNDPLSFKHKLSDFFPDTGYKMDGHPATGRTWVVLSKSDYSKLSFDKKYVIDRCMLSRSKAQTYSKIFQSEAGRGSIPWILGPASLIPVIGAAITIATSTIDGMMRLADSGSVSATQLVVLMTEGGAFIKTWSLEKHPKYGELIVAMVFYDVKVGAENRRYGIYSSKDAVLVKG